MNIQVGQIFIKSYQNENGDTFVSKYVVTDVTAKTVTVLKEGGRDAPMKRRVDFSKAFGAYCINLESYSQHRAYLQA